MVALHAALVFILQYENSISMKKKKKKNGNYITPDRICPPYPYTLFLTRKKLTNLELDVQLKYTLNLKAEDRC
jgi:hypothetical protein